VQGYSFVAGRLHRTSTLAGGGEGAGRLDSLSADSDTDFCAANVDSAGPAVSASLGVARPSRQNRVATPADELRGGTGGGETVALSRTDDTPLRSGGGVIETPSREPRTARDSSDRPWQPTAATALVRFWRRAPIDGEVEVAVLGEGDSVEEQETRAACIGDGDGDVRGAAQEASGLAGGLRSCAFTLCCGERLVRTEPTSHDALAGAAAGTCRYASSQPAQAQLLSRACCPAPSSRPLSTAEGASSIANGMWAAPSAAPNTSAEADERGLSSGESEPEGCRVRIPRAPAVAAVSASGLCWCEEGGDVPAPERGVELPVGEGPSFRVVCGRSNAGCHTHRSAPSRGC
jgi:hypothetical protein